MNDMPRLEIAAGGDYGVTNWTTADFAALLVYAWPAFRVDRAVRGQCAAVTTASVS